MKPHKPQIRKPARLRFKALELADWKSVIAEISKWKARQNSAGGIPGAEK